MTHHEEYQFPTFSTLKRDDIVFQLMWGFKNNKYGPVLTEIPARDPQVQKDQLLVTDHIEGLYDKRMSQFVQNGSTPRVLKRPHHDMGRKSSKQRRRLKDLKKECKYTLGGMTFKFEVLRDELRRIKHMRHAGQR